VEVERNGRSLAGVRGNSPGVIGGGVYGGSYADNGLGRLRTSTTDTLSSSASSLIAPSSAFTTPDLGLGSIGVMSPPTNGAGAATQTTPTPLTPVVALATSDAEAQIGLAKVAEPDLDAFMTYAAVVPEFSRLETMVVKGIV